MGMVDARNRCRFRLVGIHHENMLAPADLALAQQDHLSGRSEREIALRVLRFGSAHMNVSAACLAHRVNGWGATFLNW